MTRIPYIPENAPFTAEQRAWLNGFLAGAFGDASAQSLLPEALGEPKKPLLVLFGSQTGTAEGLAKKTAKLAEAQGFSARALSMEKYEGVEWSSERNVLLITSTYGDGEPPDMAQTFWNWLASETAPMLGNLQFSVLALGDTNYSAFCEFGKKCDARFEQLGAQRIFERKDCDVEYEEPAAEWTKGVFAALGQGHAHNGPDVKLPTAEPAAPTHDRKNPFPSRLLKNAQLTRANSAKDVRHFELSLAGSGLSYEVGDALGVFPSNCPTLVSELLALLGCDGEETVKAGNAELPLRIALTQHYDITRPSTDLLSAAARRLPVSDLATLLAPDRKDDLKQWLHGREIIDVLLGLGQPFTAAEFVALLKKLAPRLYSISSSIKAHPDEVHLTVSAVRYVTHGRARKGVASTFLADRVIDDVRAPVFVQPSHGFKPPGNPETPMIMVGPGTGIAPFRAFLEERRAIGARGRNWLFFGDQKRATDYLYEDQLEGWKKDGHLTRLDLAFSRDQAEKLYVQQRMREAASDLWAWLEEGAHFYVCGDASRMAKDVDAALHTACETAGGLSKEAAAAYVTKLKTEKRYQRDVY